MRGEEVLQQCSVTRVLLVKEKHFWVPRRKESSSLHDDWTSWGSSMETAASSWCQTVSWHILTQSHTEQRYCEMELQLYLECRGQWRKGWMIPNWHRQSGTNKWSQIPTSRVEGTRMPSKPMPPHVLVKNLMKPWTEYLRQIMPRQMWWLNNSASFYLPLKCQTAWKSQICIWRTHHSILPVWHRLYFSRPVHAPKHNLALQSWGPERERSVFLSCLNPPWGTLFRAQSLPDNRHTYPRLSAFSDTRGYGLDLGEPHHCAKKWQFII